MKIHEITESYLTELDSRGSPDTLSAKAKDLAKSALAGTKNLVVGGVKRGYSRGKNLVNPDDVTEEDINEYRPKDRQTEYYKEKTFYFDADSGKWINDETEKSAWPATQEALMNKYGFRSSGTPTRALRRKIYQKKKRAAKTAAAKAAKGKNEFTKEDIQHLLTVFQNSKNEYDSTGRLDRHLRNAEAVLSYADKGIDLTQYQRSYNPWDSWKDLSPAFLFTAKTPEDTTTLDAIYKAVLVKPDKTQFNQIKADYTTRMGGAAGRAPTSFKDIPPAQLKQINDAIIMSIRSLNTAEIAALPKELRNMEYKNFKTDDFKQTIISEINRSLTRASAPGKKLTPAQLDSLLSMITSLKPVLRPQAAALNAKLAALDFATLVPDLTDSDELILTQKRNKAKII